MVLTAQAPSLCADIMKGPATLDPALEAQIRRLAEFMSDGPATYTGTSVVAEKGTISNQLAALFTMSNWGGGNGSRQYLVIFSVNDKEIWQFLTKGHRPFQPYTLDAIVPVGDSSWRYFESAKFEANTIILNGARWVKGDAHCCPSGQARADYVLDQRGLIEIKGHKK